MMKTLTLFFALSAILLLGCNNYLELKPDKKLATPETLDDLQAILDNYLVMNQNMPIAGGEGCDNYYLLSSVWQSVPNASLRAGYIWEDDGNIPNNWISPYKTIFYANVVLDALDKIAGKNSEKQKRKELRGSALFYRAYCYYQLGQVFCLPYEPNQPGILGLPLRLNPDYNEPSVRATLAETYVQILSDLKEATDLLPPVATLKSRPSKASAYAVLAKTGLVMGNYTEAEHAADSCLKYKNELMDYNDLSLTASNPIARFNPEVIFAARSNTESSLLFASRCRIDTLLFASYATNDLRKSIYFKVNNDGSYRAKGSYDGTYSGTLFMGIATDEVYLIRAECRARNQNKTGALADLNTLLIKRMKKGAFAEQTAIDAQEALDKILNERRKELVFRGIRWSDIKRLNRESRYAVTLRRILDGTVYELKPGDKRFAYLIPTLVMNRSKLVQNQRE